MRKKKLRIIPASEFHDPVHKASTRGSQPGKSSGSGTCTSMRETDSTFTSTEEDKTRDKNKGDKTS